MDNENTNAENIGESGNAAKLPVSGSNIADSNPEVECNKCDWKGDKADLETVEDGYEDEEDVCPSCGSSDLYYFR